MRAPDELLRGVDMPRPGLYRVRLSFPGIGVHTETFPTAREANARIGILRDLRDAGRLPDDAPRQMTLGQAAAEMLDLRLTAPSRYGEPLQPGGIEWWQRITRPWITGEFSNVPVHLLNAATIIKWLRERYAAHPKTARDELTGLRNALEYAREERCTVPDRLLAFRLQKPPKRPRRRILTADETLPFALGAPAAYGRLVLLQGRVGNRIGELLQARVCDVDLERATFTVPEPKEEGRTGPKVIPLFPDEVELFREQFGVVRAAVSTPTAHLPTTAPGRPTRLVWTMPDGRAWPMVHGRVAHAYFDRHVWRPTMAAAGGLDVDPRLTSHDLRKTAITRMRDMGLSLDACATRVGHADGALIRTIYDHGHAHERAAREIAAFAALESVTADRANAGVGTAATTRPPRPAATTGKGT